MFPCVPDDMSLPTLEFRACSVLEPVRLCLLFSAAIVNCGGWVLEHSEAGSGQVSFLVEFACERAMDVYCALVALGIELGRHAHLGLTGLCQCARHGNCLKRLPIVRIRITIQSVSVSKSGEARTAPQGG